MAQQRHHGREAPVYIESTLSPVTSCMACVPGCADTGASQRGGRCRGNQGIGPWHLAYGRIQRKATFGGVSVKSLRVGCALQVREVFLQVIFLSFMFKSTTAIHTDTQTRARGQHTYADLHPITSSLLFILPVRSESASAYGAAHGLVSSRASCSPTMVPAYHATEPIRQRDSGIGGHGSQRSASASYRCTVVRVSSSSSDPPST